MKKILQLGSAFAGVIVGAGFASGQEILQYFTSFGIMGTFGAITSSLLFVFLGFTLMKLGSRLKATSHKEVIYKISGRYLGIVIDYIIIFTLFGVGVVMIAGGGSNLSQQFGLPHIFGTALMTILVILTGMLNVDRVIKIIGSNTPFLILTVVILSIYSLLTTDGSFNTLDPIAREHTSTLPNWFISGVNYVSFNIAVGVSMALVMAGAEHSEKTAALGGLVGGLIIGILIILSHLAIFSKIETVGEYEMPLLQIANEISPILGTLMAIVLFGMIFNTAASMFFAFGSRFMELGTNKFKLFILVTSIVGFSLSFVGFTELVSFFYPLIGYLGLTLIAVLVVALFRMPAFTRDKDSISG